MALRKTAKYVQACTLLDCDPEAGITHATLYRHMVGQGWEWEDGKWRLPSHKRTDTIKYRVICKPELLDDAVLALMEGVELLGWVVEYVSSEKPAEHGEKRLYIGVRPRRDYTEEAE